MKRYSVTVNGRKYTVDVEELGEGVSAPVSYSAPAPAPEEAEERAVSAPAPPAAGGVTVDSPMPGNILDVRVKTGDVVKYGEVLIILEAMKMENEIVATQDGTVSAVLVKNGDTVDTGSPLVSLG
ncbi:MAG: biotin/lipoyl-binding protein [Oscillospiraceae bacterium]|jgi:biotin carboxyl carrier protein|nr:biotin/lipoyl-binding protein [Oscillospiraceae bacterium]